MAESDAAEMQETAEETMQDVQEAAEADGQRAQNESADNNASASDGAGSDDWSSGGWGDGISDDLDFGID